MAEKCPVCDWKVEDGGTQVEVGGRTVTVCCQECADKSQADPDKYAATPSK